jgi:hypothetical protein
MSDWLRLRSGEMGGRVLSSMIESAWRELDDAGARSNEGGGGVVAAIRELDAAVADEAIVAKDEADDALTEEYGEEKLSNGFASGGDIKLETGGKRVIVFPSGFGDDDGSRIE